ncbi:MAG TPA: ubiquinone biosynthesis methyltransferase UbiE [Rhodospirillales bacterium]|nr:ubiquinone biosynthesis methyltransferase UbiE [Rhodospirillales bacterium]
MTFHSKNLIGFTKWVSSVVIIAGMALTTSNIYPLNMYMHLAGIIGWLVVSVAWHDRSLIMLNVVAAFIFINGIISNLI